LIKSGRRRRRRRRRRGWRVRIGASHFPFPFCQLASNELLNTPSFKDSSKILWGFFFVSAPAAHVALPMIGARRKWRRRRRG